MLGRLSGADDVPAACAEALTEALALFRADRPIVVVCHFDADGLSSAAILIRALRAAERACEPLVMRKGETLHDPAFAARLAEAEPGGLILCDLGTHKAPALPGCPALVIDHHVPTGEPEGAITLSGNGLSPEPTTALLAWWAAGALGDQADLLWLAAIGLIGDMAPEDAFPELATAQARWGKTALRDAVSLINAPRRTAAAHAAPALCLLLSASGPKDITKGDSADANALRAAKAEVRAAMDAAKRLPPAVNDEVALIQLDTPCQIHPLVAQQWRGRLRDKVVIAANRGYRPGWVHFAARSASGRDLIAFLAERRPAGADDRYGNSHRQATGGALRNADWNAFVAQFQPCAAPSARPGEAQREPPILTVKNLVSSLVFASRSTHIAQRGQRTTRLSAPGETGVWLSSAKGGDRCLMVQQGGRCRSSRSIIGNFHRR